MRVMQIEERVRFHSEEKTATNTHVCALGYNVRAKGSVNEEFDVM